MEADRFQHLCLRRAPRSKPKRARCWANTTRTAPTPFQKLLETLRATAFKSHTYSTPPWAFSRTLRPCPDEYDYSRQFFDRYYRPEYTTIIVAGDVDPKRVRALVDERWGTWKRGSYQAADPGEPPQDGPRTAHVDWPSPTLPWIAVRIAGPLIPTTRDDTAALDAISRLGLRREFAALSEAGDRRAEGGRAASAGPPTISIRNCFRRHGASEECGRPSLRFNSRSSRLRRISRRTPVDADKTGSAQGAPALRIRAELDNSESIAADRRRFVALRRTPETINRYYDDVREIDSRRTFRTPPKNI